jgi:hypothetical protein
MHLNSRFCPQMHLNSLFRLGENLNLNAIFAIYGFLGLEIEYPSRLSRVLQDQTIREASDVSGLYD